MQGRHDGVVVFGMEERGRVEGELVGNARADARILPQPGALDVLAGATGGAFGAGFLEHATTETGPLLAHALHLFASLFGEPTTDLVLVGTLKEPKATLVDGERGWFGFLLGGVWRLVWLCGLG